MLTIRRYISHFATCLALAVAFTACVNENLQCPVEHEDDSQGITIEFAMVTRNAMSSRSLITPLDGTREVGYAAENYLDLDNLTFLLFDDQKKMLRTFKPDVIVTDDEAGPYVKYKVTTFLHDNYFLKATTNSITFTIVVLGNYAGLSPEHFSFYIGQNLSDIFNQNKVATFSAPVSNNGKSWIPSIFGDAVTGQQRGHIPMAGMQTFTVSLANLRASSPDNPFDLSQGGTSVNKWINMLRALAKIEIIDKIAFTAGTPAASSSYVEKVELVGHTTRGSILPTYDQWTTSGTETQYVTTPSIPQSAEYVGITPEAGSLTVSHESMLLNFFNDKDATDNQEDGCKVFSCYLTEYNPADARVQSIPNMWMRLTVNSPNGSETPNSKLYRLEVAPYTNSAPGAVMPILRNNIYRYAITGISATADLRLIVDDWDLDETTWNYNQNPGIAEGGYMKWYDVSNQEIFANPQTARLVVTHDQPVSGRFTFSEPLDATWRVAFANMGQTENDAFKFIVGKDEDGNDILADEASGKIDGKPAEIKIIAPKAAATGFDRMARLIFTVETPAPDGRVLSADVAGDYYGNNQYFTIVQSAAL